MKKDYICSYINEEIANGLSKSEVESYLKELFSKTKKSVDEATKYLNESVEKIKGRKAAFVKLADKFERGFFYHLDGEFNTSIRILPSGFRYLDEILVSQGGHRGSAILEGLIKLDEIIIPENYRSISGIPNDNHFKPK
ncbi:MAG: hypothetical protein JNM71_06585 [Flavobacterium lindanitolerans]|uniref:hypothetical protein n=1 Tax=Flavobacterium lindanitolerans TaxID=428988 RepID=UPI001A419BE9|nr:hypothetical protein [Flavobacterium lindanitolerans]MBL7867670.1 hypothetical protein [Flavobacterium lindanitolerans]